MPIHGSIEEAGLPDVLQLLTLGRKSGCLSVEDGTTHGEIFLDVGRISYAAVANRDRLGDMLVKSGRITRDDLQAAALEQSAGNNRPLGRILADSGRVSRAEIEKLVRRQVEEAVYFLFTWKQGRFTFTSDKRPSHGALLVSLEPEGLLLEGARRVDEWSLIEKKIPSFEMVFQRTRARRSGGGTDNLTDDQKTLLPLLDGTRTLTGLVDLTGLNEFDAGKAIYGLLMAGFAKLVERRSVMRHLDYRELLAYVVREAEFADAERRKQAARHIVDCPACSERLRTIHVRRTVGQPIVTEEAVAAWSPSSAVTVPVPAVAAGPAASGPPPAPTVEPERAFEPELELESPEVLEERRLTEERRAGRERRHLDRRAGRDRRELDRRAGADRRGTRNAAWAQANPERRRDPRRDSDRHGGRAYDRRAGPAPQHAAAAELDTAPAARLTLARQLSAEEQPVTAVAAAPEVVATQVPEPARPSPVPETEVPGLRPSTDLVWLMSPGESIELIRASRSQLPKTEPSREAPRASPVSSMPEPEPAALPVASPQPIERPRAEPRRVVAAPDRPEHIPGMVVIPVKNLAVAASIIVVALLGYAAGSRGGAGRPSGEESGLTSLTESAQAQPAPVSPRTVTRQGGGPAPATGVPARAAVPAERATPAVQTPPRTTAAPAPTVQRPVAPPPTTPAQQQAAAVPQVAANVPAPVPAVTQPAAQPAAEPAPAAPVLHSPPNATGAEPDNELAAGGWSSISRTEASEALGGTLGAIRGLGVETVARSTSGSRVRVRLVQITAAGQRVVLTLTRAGAAVRTGAPQVTALRVMPPSEAYPFATGTVSFGNILITAKSAIPADELRGLLERLTEIR